MPKTLLVTGGAGFIGSALIRRLLADPANRVVNVDKLTYAGHLSTLAGVTDNPSYAFEQVDICDSERLTAVFAEYSPDAVFHLAAESHVDRSIAGPASFIQTNIVGTSVLLEAARHHWDALPVARRGQFRFVHVSTDEVFGSLGPRGRFTEQSPYRPNSPYAASKASSDHLARAWNKTFDLPVVITHSSNNYGPYQFPEKLIPLMITRALAGETLPVYGAGNNIRDWIFVDDHAAALELIGSRGRPGETYNIGASCELSNLEVVHNLCELIDELCPRRGLPRRSLARFVADRPGHDYRYAVDAGKLELELGWRPAETFASGLRKTVTWYLENTEWLGTVTGGAPAADESETQSIGIAPTDSEAQPERRAA